MDKLRRLALARPALLILVLLFSAHSIGAQEGWWMGRNQGADLSAVYAISPESGDKNSTTHLWVGDDAGNFGVVLNPEGNDFFKVNMVPVGPPPPRPRPRTPPPPATPINDIYFLDAGYGFLLKGNIIYTNRGGTWAPFLTVPAERDGSTATLYSLSFFPENRKRGCVVGVYSRKDVVSRNLVLCGDLQDGTLTADWKRPVIEESQNEFFHLALVENKYGWIVGSDGTIFHTTDAGASWQRQDSTATVSLFHTDFLNHKEGFAVGEYAMILRTEDGGKHWQRVPTPLVAAGEVSLVSVKFADDNRGWAVGRKGVILYTKNGGKDWTLVQVPQLVQSNKPPEDLYGLFVDNRYCWVVGGKGLILRYRLKK